MSWAKVILPVHAKSHEVVEIHWHMPDGSIHKERRTCPPASTINERDKPRVVGVGEETEE